MSVKHQSIQSILKTPTAIRVYFNIKPLDGLIVVRVIKCCLATLTCFILVLITPIQTRLGSSYFLICICSVLVHPGRRAGAMFEAAFFVSSGCLLGVSFTLLGRFLSQRILGSEQLLDPVISSGRYQGALSLLAIFELIMLIFHGFVKSKTPRLAQFCFVVFLVCHFGLLSDINASAGLIARDFTAPIFLGMAVCVFYNLAVFPEFGSSYLGTSAMNFLDEFEITVNLTRDFFLGISQIHGKSSEDVNENSLAKITSQKSKMRTKLVACKSTLAECIFEFSYAYLSPQELKPFINKMDDLTLALSALVDATELEYALIGRATQEFIDVMRPEKEIEYADETMLAVLIDTIRDPVTELSSIITESMSVIKSSLAYTYDVNYKRSFFPKLTGKNDAAKQISLEKVDQFIQRLALTIKAYDFNIRLSLENMSINALSSATDADNYLMPRDELFLISSFLLNYREMANSVCKMLVDFRNLIEIRDRRQARGAFGRKLWFSNLTDKRDWKAYLGTSRDDDKDKDDASILTQVNRAAQSEVIDEENGEINADGEKSIDTKDRDPANGTIHFKLDRNSCGHTKQINVNKESKSLWLKKTKIRHFIADVIEYPGRFKKDWKFALKVAIPMMIITFPAFTPSMRQWYGDIRGSWVGFVFILVIENSVGGTIWNFFIRTFGVVIGSAWAVAAYRAGYNGDNLYVITFVMFIGFIFVFYIMLATPYFKSGMIAASSMNIVILATLFPTVPGTIIENFTKRSVAMIVGGAFALGAQLVLFPTRSRDQLVLFVGKAITNLGLMESVIALGIEGQVLAYSMASDKKFSNYAKAARASLSVAEAYKATLKREPRIKGQSGDIEKIYTEMIFVIRQIIDRMENVMFLRRKYGSFTLEELNPYVYQYRRQISSSIILIMRTAEEALKNKRPIPQFLPSARIAHRRYVNRVREVLMSDLLNKVCDEESDDDQQFSGSVRDGSEYEIKQRQKVLRRKFMSWSASSCAIEEVVEYIESLTELIKLLVGVNHFKYGFLSRPLYEDWAAHATRGFDDF
ncbi:hypothetical protein NADFUDRAFT_21746, partial [Nadsonia fulvescens var. elongata DSM 6958]